MSNPHNPTTWARLHKNDFAKKLIRDSGASSDGSSSAIFMAGLPGAGKTEFTKNLIKNSDLKVVRLDMDEIASQIEDYQPQIADAFREGATVLLDRVFDLTIRGGYDFIMDGTFSSNKALKNIDRVIKHNYAVKVIYVHQDPKLAWRFTQAREKVEKRSIDLAGFINSYFGTIANLRKLPQEIAVDLIEKGPDNGVLQWHRNIDITTLDEIIKIHYNKDKLKEYVNG